MGCADPVRSRIQSSVVEYAFFQVPPHSGGDAGIDAITELGEDRQSIFAKTKASSPECERLFGERLLVQPGKVRKFGFFQLGGELFLDLVSRAAAHVREKKTAAGFNKLRVKVCADLHFTVAYGLAQ